MLQYILECMAFQLIFLLVYDILLKKETFFLWNRIYLLSTYLLSMLLPWIKIKALETAIPEKYYEYSEFLWSSTVATTTVLETTEEEYLPIAWEGILFYGGMIVAVLLFVYKLFLLYQLRKSGEVHYFDDFTQVTVPNSVVAFSFFKSIFLGDAIAKADRDGIIEHELVHIKQRHSLDLLFFELMRILAWFNPLVYIYQNKITELHEFMADAQVAKTNRKEQYELLLSQIFHTKHISFINKFFSSSLIKKRIVMLQKRKSRKVFQLKYLLLLPVLFTMLAYTSLQQESTDLSKTLQDQTLDDAELIVKVKTKIEEEIRQLGSFSEVRRRHPRPSASADAEGPVLSKEDYFESAVFFILTMNDLFKEMDTKEDNTQKNGYKIPWPSTPRYESYYKRKKAFMLLDKNLKFSIISTSKEIGYDVLQINHSLSRKDHLYVVQVEDVSDLTGAEIKRFNQSMNTVFTGDSGDYEGLLLRDDRYSFQIEETVPRIGINTFPKVIAKEKESPTPVTSQKDIALGQKILPVPFAEVEEAPLFPDCVNASDKKECFLQQVQHHIIENFAYPEEAMKNNIEGRVSVLFTITDQGKITNIKKRGPHIALEDEAVRIISLLPKMTAGRHKGEPVHVAFSIPINFRLTKDPVAPNASQPKLADVPFAIIDEVPIFPGCEDVNAKRACFQNMVQAHIKEHLIFPKEAKDKGLQGNVHIMFVVDKKGRITNIRKRGPSKVLEDEAVRIIALLPQMKPGMQQGKAVNVPFSIPINFNLK